MSQRQIVVDDPLPEEEIVFCALDENYLGNHCDQFFLAEDNKDKTFVYSTMFSPLGGCHVYCYAPSEILGRKHWTLVTMGMSGTKMRVPPDVPEPHLCDRAELMCYLPPDWKFPAVCGDFNKHTPTNGDDPASSSTPVDAPTTHYTDENWPIQLLRDIAQYVNVYGAWVAEDHGLPNFLSDPPGLPFTPTTKLSHVILLSPVEEEERMTFCIVPDKKNDEEQGEEKPSNATEEEEEKKGQMVNFYLVVPLTTAEAQWKREVGASESIYYIVGSKAIGGNHVMVDYVIDHSRPCAVEDLHCREIYDFEHLQQKVAKRLEREEEDEESWEDVDEERDDVEDGDACEGDVGVASSDLENVKDVEDS